MKQLLYSCCILLCFTQVTCKKEKHKSPLEVLPAITQEGKNTVGCLINGEAYIPKGFIQYTPNFHVVVDPTYKNGDFSLRTVRLDRKKDERLYLTINSDSIRSVGTYVINDTGNTRSLLSKGDASLSKVYCNVHYNGTYHRKGFLKITKYDMQKGIVSGEFEFSMVNRDCGFGDTIKVTNGRFDYKL